MIIGQIVKYATLAGGKMVVKICKKQWLVQLVS